MKFNAGTQSITFFKTIRYSALLIGLLALLSVTTSAQATSRGYHQAHEHYDYAPVVWAKPIYVSQEYSRPREECWSEQVQYGNSSTEYSRSSRSNTGTLLGGIIGAAVGNELGHDKRNKQVGAVAGALLGASIGRDVSRSDRNHHRHQQVPRYRTERRCKTVHDYHSKEILKGYRVKYRYQGQSHVIKTSRHPGDTIKLKISATPIL